MTSRPYASSRSALPSAWDQVTRNTTNRNQVAAGLLKVDGLQVRYVGPIDDDKPAAAARANHPTPADTPLYYFEITVLNKGLHGFIGVGYQTEEAALHRLPGWEQHSYGYHGDDGGAFCGSGRGRPYGQPFTTGDVVGALLNRAERTITFYKNGVDMGTAFTDVPEAPLYPVVGLNTRGEEVLGNFGGVPFTTDLPALQTALQERLLCSIRSCPLPQMSSSLPQLVLDHLVHHRCWRTAEVLSRDVMGRGQPGDSLGTSVSDVDGMKARQQVYDCVAAGRAEEAITLLEQGLAPQTLSRNPRLEFRLRVQHFVSLVGQGDVDGALQYARTTLAKAVRDPRDRELFEDALALLAYDQPASCPSGYLMSSAHQVTLAEELSSAVLASQGRPSTSPLERLLAQTITVFDEAKRMSNPRVSSLDVRKIVFGGALLQPPPPPPQQPKGQAAAGGSRRSPGDSGVGVGGGAGKVSMDVHEEGVEGGLGMAVGLSNAPASEAVAHVAGDESVAEMAVDSGQVVGDGAGEGLA